MGAEMNLDDTRALCRHCHTCGTKLKQVLDGEEWCPHCKTYRRYHSHGWTHVYSDKTPCLSSYERMMKQEALLQYQGKQK